MNIYNGKTNFIVINQIKKTSHLNLYNWKILKTNSLFQQYKNNYMLKESHWNIWMQIFYCLALMFTINKIFQEHQ